MESTKIHVLCWKNWAMSCVTSLNTWLSLDITWQLNGFFFRSALACAFQLLKLPRGASGTSALSCQNREKQPVALDSHEKIVLSPRLSKRRVGSRLFVFCFFFLENTSPKNFGNEWECISLVHWMCSAKNVIIILLFISLTLSPCSLFQAADAFILKHAILDAGIFRTSLVEMNSTFHQSFVDFVNFGACYPHLQCLDGWSPLFVVVEVLLRF